MSHEYKFGIEEEYFLAVQKSGHSPPRDIATSFHKAAAETVDLAEHELLVGQIEISTEPGVDLDDALAKIRKVRQTLSAIASDYGLHLFAAGSHPLAFSDEQHVSATDRYERLGDELKLIAPKAPVCAMHVHVEVPDYVERVRLINRLMPFLPLLLALSVSSPFWEGRNSGLQGYRLTAFSQWPRAGLPNFFSGPDEYERYINRLKSAGFVEDGSFLWSHIRPSVRYPTIEMRICDSCTSAADAAALTALYRSLVRATVRCPEINAAFGEHAICGINLWRAQQAGTAASFADLSSERTLTVREMLEETLDLVAEDFDALGLSQWPQHLRGILSASTSADRQLKVSAGQTSNGSEDALRAVIHSLSEETISS